MRLINSLIKLITKCEFAVRVTSIFLELLGIQLFKTDMLDYFLKRSRHNTITDLGMEKDL